MFTIKVSRDGIVLFRHFPTRADMGEGARRAMTRGEEVLDVFMPGEAWA